MTLYKKIISEGKWMLYLKSLLEQCCLQTGSWYSNSSNIIGLPFVEEPSWDWEDPKGLCRAWLLGKRHTSLPFPCSRMATVSVNLYKSDTFNLCPNLKARKKRCWLRTSFTDYTKHLSCLSKGLQPRTAPVSSKVNLEQFYYKFIPYWTSDAWHSFESSQLIAYYDSIIWWLAPNLHAVSVNASPNFPKWKAIWYIFQLGSPSL